MNTLKRGILTSSFYTKAACDSLKSVDWITRLKIAIGVAGGLTFMHHECYPPLAHGDVQASSILLDHDFEVRLGCLNNASAQDIDSGDLNLKATCADDVYYFGRVLLALVTGNFSLSSSADTTMKNCLEGTLANMNFDDVMEIVDPSLIADEDLLMEVWSMAIVAKSCLNPDPSIRPLMRDILNALEDPMRVIREGHITSHQAMEELLDLDSQRHIPVSSQSYFKQLICGLVKT